MRRPRRLPEAGKLTTVQTGNNAKHSVLCHSYHSGHRHDKTNAEERVLPCTRELKLQVPSVVSREKKSRTWRSGVARSLT